MGTVTAAGLYTAPATTPSPASVNVQATSVVSSTATSSATVTVITPLVTAAAASRFLEQATFGPTPALITQVRAAGFSGFLTSQFSQPSSSYPNPPDTDPTTNSPNIYQQAFLTNALNSPDQLRQRVAFALQKLWVVSWVVVNTDEGYLYYLRMHQAHAFDNYRQIMEDVTLSPSMGQYQDVANNDKPNPALGIAANENYGRELMQLFTVGLVDLNPNGTFIIDSSTGLPKQSYDPVDTVAGNARAITGWTYLNAPGQNRTWPRPPYFGGQMEVVQTHHDTSGGEILLRGLVLPPGGTAAGDMKITLDNIFNDPNLCPFISRLFIQQFTTSNPTSAYVGRVAQACTTGLSNGFGAGTRGDMKAIIAAILLDSEARAGDSNPPAAGFGKLREPVLFLTGILRASGATSDGTGPRSVLSGMGQNLFFPATVFSYFSPDFQIPGTTLFGPEYQIQTTATVFQRYNFVNSLVFGSVGGTTVDLTPLMSLSQNPNAAGQLLDTLNLLFMHGSMSSQTRQSILTAVNSVPAGANQLRDRARTALYLVASSSQYQVQH
ncbi:MAG: DUF1800 family protein [Acidobacteria bacterium]|nr:DUF1800 family protein [Acidobacteriota bacterium]